MVEKNNSDIPRWRTAIARRDISKPSKHALKYELYSKDESVLDYGCGRGFDVQALAEDGYNIKGWDPHFSPDAKKPKSDTVNIGYVLNVIENPKERADVLKEALSLAKKRLIVSVRPDSEARGLKNTTKLGDGIVTSTGTFQKFFTQNEFGKYMAKETGLSPYLLDKGIAVVFKDKSAEKAFLQKYKENHKGREIKPFEAVEKPAALKKKLPHKQVSLRLSMARIDDSAKGSDINPDIVVAAAVAKLRTGKAATASDLPKGTKATDMKAVNKQADKLIVDAKDPSAIRRAITFATKKDHIGKNVGGTLYVHESAQDRLPPVLKLLKEQAKDILKEANANGSMQVPKSQEGFEYSDKDTTLLKLERDGTSVSLLKYNEFDKDPHPALVKSVNVKLGDRIVKGQDFSTRDNPPILHRKETFVAPDYPKYKQFEALTKAEEKAGLYEANLSKIGTAKGWEKVLKEKGVKIKGHKVEQKGKAVTAAIMAKAAHNR